MNNKEGLFIGGASAVGGYLLASLLDGNIKHHALAGPEAKGTACNCAALKSPPNTLNCTAVSNCVGICGLTSEIAVCNARAASKAGQTPHIPSGTGTATGDIFGAGIPLGGGGGSSACSANCGPVLSDPICNTNKLLNGCGGSNTQCIPGLPVPCEFLVIGAFGLGILYLLKR